MFRKGSVDISDEKIDDLCKELIDMEKPIPDAKIDQLAKELVHMPKPKHEVLYEKLKEKWTEAMQDENKELADSYLRAIKKWEDTYGLGEKEPNARPHSNN